MAKEKRRFWITYNSESSPRPVLWEMSQKHALSFNIRNASISSEMAIMAIELEGERSEIKAAIQWLEENQVAVEPVEIQTIEG